MTHLEYAQVADAPHTTGTADHVNRSRLSLGNRRSRTLLWVGLCVAFLLAMIATRSIIGEDRLATALKARNLAPGLSHPFGTDWLGRDMLTRTALGLSLSLRIGLLAATVSAIVGAALGLLAAAFGGKVDVAITWLVDLFMSMPHLVLMILISFCVGGGLQGVVLAVAVTHWPGLCRILRAEALQINSQEYVQLAARLDIRRGGSPATTCCHT